MFVIVSCVVNTSFSVLHVSLFWVGDLFSLIWSRPPVDVCDNKTFLLCCLFSSSFFFWSRYCDNKSHAGFVVCVSPVFLNGLSSNMSVIIMWCLCGSRVFLFCLLWSGCYDIKLIRWVLVFFDCFCYLPDRSFFSSRDDGSILQVTVFECHVFGLVISVSLKSFVWLLWNVRNRYTCTCTIQLLLCRCNCRYKEVFLLCATCCYSSTMVVVVS